MYHGWQQKGHISCEYNLLMIWKQLWGLITSQSLRIPPTVDAIYVARVCPEIQWAWYSASWASPNQYC